jgi:hypothetical protein
MIYSEEILRNIINKTPVGDLFPYKGGTKKQIESYIKSIVADLEMSELITVEADFNKYESGFASFIDIFCYKSDGSSIMKRKNSLWIDGISIYISTCAPVAIYGANFKTKKVNKYGGSYGILDVNCVATTPKGYWVDVLYIIAKNLNRFGIEIIQKRELNKPLDFQVKIPTNLNYHCINKVFDAIFYYND